MIPQEIIERLQKLFAFKEGAERIGSLHEAENAAIRIQEILVKYNITEADARNQKEKSDVMHKIYKLGQRWKKNEGEWITQLFIALCQYNFCQVIRFQHRHKQFENLMLIGKEFNIDVIIYAADQFIDRLRPMSKAAWENYNGFDKKNRYIRSYFLGAVVGIRDKLQKEWQELQKQNPNAKAIILSNEEALNHYVNDNVGKTKEKRFRGSDSYDGFQKGRRDGNNMSIHRGVNSNTDKRNLLD